jgi:hypothetical protein
MKTVLLIIFTLFSVLSYAQDIIYKVDGTEIKSKVIEITENYIKYKNFDQQEGPIRNINKSEVFMIIYSDGTKETFTTQKQIQQNIETKTEVKNVENNTQPNQGKDINSKESNNKQQKEDKFYKDKKDSYFSTAIGYGTSYGGFGIRQDFRGGKILGFGLHVGAGYFPFNGGGFLISGGAKFYFYKGFYLNFQYGYVGIEQTTVDSYNGTTYIHEEKKYTLHGPSFLIGGDWFFGKRFGLNIGAGVTIVENSTLIKNAGTLDVGFIIKY